MAHKPLNERTIERIALRFKVLGDPVRLRLLHALGEKERSVTELVDLSGAGQANVSKHLQLLLREGLVTRRKNGLQVFYSVADPKVFALCDLVCGSLSAHLEEQLKSLDQRARRARG